MHVCYFRLSNRVIMVDLKIKKVIEEEIDKDINFRELQLNNISYKILKVQESLKRIRSYNNKILWVSVYLYVNRF